MKNHKRTIIQIILTLSMVFSCFSGFTSVSATEDIKVKVDNDYVEFDVQPQLIGGRTMVPLRAIFEAIGATVSWEAETSTITAYNETHIVKATIGNETMTVDGEKHTMDVSPMIIDGRTLVPARFVAEAFDCDVEWDSESLTVNITTTPIDYTQVEKDTNSQTNEVNSNSENNSVESKYYKGTNIPNYAYVTGAKLKKFSPSETTQLVGTFHYALDTNGFVQYYKYLLNDGWSENERKETSSAIECFMIKDGKMILLDAELKYDEVWIIY